MNEAAPTRPADPLLLDSLPDRAGMTLVDAQNLYEFLQGGPQPEGFRIRARPRLSPNAAFAVLYVMQEKYRLIPDTFEQCSTCRQLFDSAETGDYNEPTGKHFCDEHSSSNKACDDR